MVKVDYMQNRNSGGRMAFETLAKALEWVDRKESDAELYVTHITESGQEIPRETWENFLRCSSI